MTSQVEGRSAALRIHLLGRFQVVVGGRIIEEAEWRLRKAKQLVKLLALAADHTLHREQLTEALWPELEPEAGANNLHKILHVARRTLGQGPEAVGQCLHLQQDLVALRPEVPLWTDVAAFTDSAADARRTRDLALYQKAIDLYAGDLLPEDRYEEWAAAKRDELKDLYVALLMEEAALREAAGDPAAAVHSLQRVTAQEPGHEAAHIELIRLHAQGGHRHQALRQFHKLRQVLKDELDVEPSLQAQQLYEAVLNSAFSAPAAPAVPTPSPSTPSGANESLPPLVGREQEVDRLEEVLEDFFAGKGGLVLLSGEAGVGKSRLAQELLHRAVLRGARGLWGGAYEQETQLPYGPFLEAFQDLHPHRRAHDLEELLGAPQAVRVDVMQQPRGGGPSPSTERQRLFAAVANFVAGLIAQAPVVLVLDDLHAADEASLQLLHFLARTTRDTPLLIAATFRPEELEQSSHLAAFLAVTQRERLAVRIDLQRLSPHESELLVVSLLDPAPIDNEVFETVYEFSEGNPFYTEEFVRSLREGDLLGLVDGRWRLRSPVSSVPLALAEVIAHRLRRLRPATRQTLNLMAVVGRETAYPLLRAASGTSEAELLDALDDAFGHRVIHESADGYRFTHPLQRAVLYQQMGRARRMSLHGHIARTLESLHGQRLETYAPELAHHYARSEEPLDAVPHLRSAARQAAGVFANEQAVRLYQEAIIILESSPKADDEELAGLLEEAGDVLHRAGEPGRSEQFYDRAMRLLSEKDDSAGTARLRAKAALSAITQGNVDHAGSLLKETLETMNEQWPQLVVARTYYALAQLRWHSAQHQEALQAAELALQAAQSSEDVRARAHAYEVMALACHSLGDWQKGIEYELQRNELGLSGFDTDEAFDAHL